MEDKILEFIERNCNEKTFHENNIANISANIKLARNQCSIIINKLVEDNILVRIEEKPFIFLSKKYLKDNNIKCEKQSYKNLDILFNNDKRDFKKLVGYNHSLKDTVKQCKATISYPPNGLPLLLYGPTGTGKSFIAKLTYEWARNKEIIKEEGKFITVNCSEYANNPELLTANLFGHVKGAFTGADKDNEGLIALADNGVLFLDEVHGLKAECQEKLFLFMDQGIYHRVGDNEKWYHSNVRLIFATTENPEKVLLKTLLRRIPMTITIPSLEQRGTRERIELLYAIFSKEEKRLGCKIKMSLKVYNALLSAKMSGNIGELKSVVQSCCINSLFDRSGDELYIHLDSLPKHILNQIYENPSVTLDGDEYISVEYLKGFYSHDKEIIQLNNEILNQFNLYSEKKIDITKFMETCKKQVQNYLDNLVYRKKETSQFQYYKRGVSRVFEMIESHFGIKATNNDLIAIALYLEEMRHDSHDLSSWNIHHFEECEDLMTLLENEYFRATNISLEICTYLKSYLELDVSTIVVIVFILYIYNAKKDQRLAQKACVVLAHGYSTASSIADAANRFLQEYIFDAIDMPLYVDTNVMIDKLNTYIARLGKLKELYLLVDMGSLKEIYKGLNVEKVNVGIINNVSTPMALEIGNSVRLNRPMEDIFKDVITGIETSLEYHIEKHDIKQPVILCSCASGDITSRKLKTLIEESFPQSINIEVQTYDYNDLVYLKDTNSILENYDLICTIGTLDPNIEQLKFVGIEDLIINDSFKQLNDYFGEYMSEEQLLEFNKNILHNFSLSNIMNNLTILNPSKLLEQVSNSLDVLQDYLALRLSSRTCFGLYVHISCLIERLVIHRNNESYVDCGEFEKEHGDFIKYVKRAFKNIEEFYGVIIPVEEITFIYNYVKNN